MTAVATQSLNTSKSARKPLVLATILLALSAPLITWFLDGYFDQWFGSTGSVIAGLITFWLIAGLVLLLTRAEAQQTGEGSMWSSIGFKPVKLRESLIVMIIGFISLFVVNVLYVILSRTIFPTEINMSKALLLPAPLIFMVYLTSIFTEEILYRGYALERLQRLTGNWWISGGITWAIFVALHIPAYPMAHIVGFVAPAAVVITLVYAWKRNITYTVMLHGCMNFTILLAAIFLPLLQAAA